MKWLLIVYNYGLIQVVNQLWGVCGGNGNLDFHSLMRMDHPIMQGKSLSLSNGDTMYGSSWVCWVCSPLSGDTSAWATACTIEAQDFLLLERSWPRGTAVAQTLTPSCSCNSNISPTCKGWPQRGQHRWQMYSWDLLRSTWGWSMVH